MTKRMFTIIGSDRNPDTEEGVGLAEQLQLEPRDASEVMGREAFEIFIPFDETTAIESTRLVDETLAKFKALGYEVEERA
jgi:hypothetical protein